MFVIGPDNCLLFQVITFKSFSSGMASRLDRTHLDNASQIISWKPEDTSNVAFANLIFSSTGMRCGIPDKFHGAEVDSPRGIGPLLARLGRAF